MADLARPEAEAGIPTSESIFEAALNLDLPISFKSTKNSIVPGNKHAGGVARSKPKIRYRHYKHKNPPAERLYI